MVHAERAAEAAQQHGDVGALGAVVGVELVEHEVLQRVGFVGGPEVAVLTPEQEEVEHLVVGEQDVGRVVAQHFALVDEVVLPHLRVATRLADVEPGPQPGELRLGVDQLSDAAGLVGGERVHRIEDQRLDARPPCEPFAGAVVEDGVQEAFGLARAGAGGDQGRLPAFGHQPRSTVRMRSPGVGMA